MHHARSIELLTWSFGDSISTDAAASTPVRDRSQASKLVFVAKQSKASPKLWLHAANGHPLHSATLDVVSKGERRFNSLTLKLADVYVASYQSAPDESSGVPLDVVHLDYRSLTFTQRTVNHLGALVTTTTGWNFHTGDPV